ncbi:MAG: DUF2867 domain-containing protein [Candidatus Sphingomonas phytovorans]|nr:DUF2867 domain-containing protein [Sphingomonas sp.]WEK00741.1 MAG: DUF2867 domain-containing protein [Sphingomonas sp.]
MIKAIEVPAPSDSMLAVRYAGADLLDAYAIALPVAATGDIEQLTRAVLARPAGWTRALMRIRDGLMAPLGVKTSAAIARNARGESIDFFPVVERSARELVVGENDRHLDFRTSILLRDTATGEGRELVAITVVHCHNLLGRAYLTVIAPFHRVIVKSYLDRAAARGWR